MIGIYLIQNLSNNRVYIGQSNNVQRRIKEHFCQSRLKDIPLDKAILKYGKDNFSWNLLEECSIEKLDEREQYWIQQYKNSHNVYNINEGGFSFSGENNGRAKLTESDIIQIRKYYQNKTYTRKQIYELFKDKISFGQFSRVWDGSSWSYIMPEVFTNENKEYYKKETSIGEKSLFSKFNDEEIINIRNRYVKETAKEIWENYSDRINYSQFQAILWGRSYKHLPIYSKKLKKWIT